MNCIGAKLEQNAIDIQKLQAERNELLEEKRQQQKDTFEKYIESHPVYYHYCASITNYKGNRLVKVPLPQANSNWTFSTFTWVKNFYTHFGYLGVYPVHGDEYMCDSQNIYIRIPHKKQLL